MKPIAIILFLALLTLDARSVFCAPPLPPKDDSFSDEALIIRWRQKKITIADIEAETQVELAVNREDQIWKFFKELVKPGDDIWSFKSPTGTWEHNMGWQGYAIFRNEKLIYAYTTLRN